MKKIMMMAVMLGLAGSAHAAEFSDLAMTAKALKASVATEASPKMQALELAKLYGFGSGQSGCVLPDQTGSTNPVRYFDRGVVAGPEVRATWLPSEFTDPRNHNEKNFRYLVHTIDVYGNGYSAQASYDYLMNSIAGNPCSALSVSAINQDMRGTFGDMGFILRVPAENVIFAKSTDMGTVNLTANTDPLQFNKYMNFYFKFGATLTPPGDVIHNTNRPPNYTRYNEVLVQGKVESGISITGIVIVSKDTYRNPALLAGMKQLAAEKHLPVVYIENVAP